MMRTFLLVALLATPAAAQDDHDDHDDHVAEAEGVRIVHAWTAATEDSTAMVFMEVENAGEAPVTLTGGQAHDAEAAELVGFGYADGEGAWTVLPRVVIAPGDHLDLSPDVLAIRLIGLEASLVEGETLDLDVTFEDLVIEVEVEVEAEGATAHGHAGHAH